MGCRRLPGTRRSITTKAYLVPSGTIQLFSPQVYIAENPTNSCFHHDSNGISLTLTCGTKLSFPLHNNNNLPIMLTHKAIHPSTHVVIKQIHVSYRDPLHSINNIIAFIATSTFLMFTSAVNDLHRPRESTFNVPIAAAVFRKSNWNLDPAQQELLLWHYRLGHIGMETVQRLLAKPHSSTALVPKYRIRVITPKNPKSYHCCTPLCAACQFGRQK